jgi:hypothetical protein
MTVNNKVERIWKKEFWLNWEVYPKVLLGQLEVNQETLHTGLSQSRPIRTGNRLGKNRVEESFKKMFHFSEHYLASDRVRKRLCKLN